MGTKYANRSSIKAVKDSIAGFEKQLADPVTSRAIRQKERHMATYKAEKAMLERITPPDVVPEEKPKLVKRLQQLEESMIAGNIRNGIEPMLSDLEMWGSPAGAVGREIRFQQFWKNHNVLPNGDVYRDPNGYGAIFEWKDGRRRLLKEREDEDRDVSNIELFRPTHPVDNSLANYRRRSYAPFTNLSYDDVDRIFPEREPSDVEKKVRQSELSKKLEQDKLQKLSEARVPTAEEFVQAMSDQTTTDTKIHTTWTRCKYIEPSSKRRCKSRGKGSTGYCFRHEVDLA